MATVIEQFTTYHSLELDFTLSLLSLVCLYLVCISRTLSICISRTGPLVLTLLYIADQTRRAYRLRPVYYVIVTATAAAAAVSTAADARDLWL